MAPVSTAFIQVVLDVQRSCKSQYKTKTASFGSNGEKCAEERGSLQKEYEIKELETVATKDKKLEELISLKVLEHTG